MKQNVLKVAPDVNGNVDIMMSLYQTAGGKYMAKR